MKNITLFVIRFYKAFISDILFFCFGRGCRFEPTCSDYAKEAIMKYGARKGGVLAIKRIAKCHPFSQPGFDPVPNEL